MPDPSMPAMLPADGIPPEEITRRLTEMSAGDLDWRAGRHWSLVYDSPPWHRRIVEAAARQFAHENALSHSAFPSAAMFESKVVAMAASVISPGVPYYGQFTSGGTESIMAVLRAYRETATHERDEVIVPTTAHPAFWKAAHYLGLRLRLVPVGPDGRADPTAIQAAIGPSTAVVGLSAPCFPYGVVDPIEEIAALAAHRGVGVHVDAALGGLFLPFLDPPVPRFGINVPGVTSVSVDLHKYGYGVKGAAVVLFSSAKLRRGSYYVATGWPGGAYAANAVLGTRAVGPAAAAWSSMVALGQTGYRQLVRSVMATASTLRQGMVEQGWQIVGGPEMSVFAATSTKPPVASVAAGLQRRDWQIDTLEDPAAMHFVVFPRHAGLVNTFLADLSAATAEARAGRAETPPMSSYGVMVRGKVTEERLYDHLDARYDLTREFA